MLKKVADAAIVLASVGLLLFLWSSNQRLAALEGASTGTMPAPRAAAPAMPVETAAEGVAIGSPNAPVTIVQFTDYECPFCQRFAKETLPTLVAKYIDTGKARLIVRDLPLSIHANARTYAAAARCADDMAENPLAFQNALYEGAPSPDSAIIHAARAAELSLDLIVKCIESGKFNAAIDRDIDDAIAIGISGTPSFVIGPTGKTVTGYLIDGARPLSVFVSAVDSVLAKL